MAVMLFKLHFKTREQFVAEKQTDWIGTLGNHNYCKIKRDERQASLEEAWPVERLGDGAGSPRPVTVGREKRIFGG